MIHNVLRSLFFTDSLVRENYFLLGFNCNDWSKFIPLYRYKDLNKEKKKKKTAEDNQQWHYGIMTYELTHSKQVQE